MDASSEKPPDVIWRMRPGDKLDILSRPRGTSRAPLLGQMGAAIFSEATIQEIARGWKEPLSIESTLDQLLLALWDALFLEQCEG